ncbi:MAG: hypothetical protein AUK44_00875 [Porphyromonadaceae bacterium CG2_30_38_12]|nr:MAG: hypothetical protein AUK44_00875 [Porphyromonadaceae bacterium CG2_30_38_12]
MEINKKKIFKIVGILALTGIIIGGATAYYLFNMPHRNVQNTEADLTVEASSLVQEFIDNTTTANTKYLAEDGDSKVLAIHGIVSAISDDMNAQKVVVLKAETDKAGVSCTFTEETNAAAASLQVGDVVTIKGVIRSGASYDSDLEIYENIIIEKAAILQ